MKIIILNEIQSGQMNMEKVKEALAGISSRGLKQRMKRKLKGNKAEEEEDEEWEEVQKQLMIDVM